LNHGALIDGTNALILAARRDNIVMVRLLIDAGCDINAMDAGGGPCNGGQEPFGFALHEALFHGHVEISKILLDNGADSTLHDWSGKTPLMRAEESKNADIVELLKSYSRGR